MGVENERLNCRPPAPLTRTVRAGSQTLGTVPRMGSSPAVLRGCDGSAARKISVFPAWRENDMSPAHPAAADLHQPSGVSKSVSPHECRWFEELNVIGESKL